MPKVYFHTRISPFSLQIPHKKHHNPSHGGCIEEFHSEIQQCCGDLSNLSFLKPSTKNLKASHISWFMCQKVSDHGWKLQCRESLGPVSFFKSKKFLNGIPLRYKGIQISTAHSAVSACGQVQRSTTQTGPRWWRQDPFTETDQLLFTMQTRLAPQPDLFSIQSHSAASH